MTGVLAEVGLRGFEGRPPYLLSGGEKKAVEIAGVLAMEPGVLVFDEPTRALEPASALVVMELLDELNASGTTIVVSTHDVETRLCLGGPGRADGWRARAAPGTT